MKIEIFPSASGDCVLLTSSDDKRLLADAGLPKAYDHFIASPLAKLRTAGKSIDVAYVSHIDQDHIGGILKLLSDEVAWRAFDHAQANGGRLGKPKVPRPPEIKQLWHNAFLEDIERTEQVDLGTALASSAGVLSGLNAAALGGREAQQIASETRMLALSVGEAIELNWRIGRDQLGIPLNPEFAGELMTARPNTPITLGALKITVLGPTAKQLTALRKAWIVWLNKSKKRIEELRKAHQRDADAIGSSTTALDLANLSRDIALAVEKDVTPPNLASLVLLVEERGKRVLLTGDAGDESLLEYLEAANLLDASGKIEVDVLKVPHHGAHNSYSPRFVASVRASHLIFCGDGEHHNPEPDVVKGYIDAVKAAPLSDGRTTTFWFNWSSVRASEFQDLWDEVEGLFNAATSAAKITRRSLRKTETSMAIDLA
ncbi:ComEC/Rec2 family competence protein [Sphingomonas sp. LT1P40]|uniref:ComEC/Rec2 family competence protein n=1 Tax=Alteristakelama amylovorans TaxID=3096166 RepID=UPI002FC6F7EA